MSNANREKRNGTEKQKQRKAFGFSHMFLTKRSRLTMVYLKIGTRITHIQQYRVSWQTAQKNIAVYITRPSFLQWQSERNRRPSIYSIYLPSKCK